MSTGIHGRLERKIVKPSIARRAMWTVATLACLGILGMPSPAPSASAETLNIATWNIEHLRDGVDDPSRFRRTAEEFDRLRQHAQRLGADVIAVQEIENTRALARVFDPARYAFFVSDRRHTQRTGFAVRRSISAKRHPDLTVLGAGGRLRHGVDVEISVEGRTLRLLSVHLKSFCFEGSVMAPRSDACRKLALQIPALERWIDDRAKENTPFAVLGDFNRRFDAPGDDFWPMIDDGDPTQLKLRRANAGKRAMCNGGRYPLFIDHIVYDHLASTWVVPGSFEELVYTGSPLSDHCPVSLTLNMRRR